MPSLQSGDRRQAELARLTALPFAHRGLHGGGIVENSRAAFEAAMAAGHGIELDVQASRGGSAFVFHDWLLDRLAEAEGAVADREPGELLKIRLRGTAETIPDLPEMLRLVAGRVPLLIELKAKGPIYPHLCRNVAMALRDYHGPVGVMAFDPRVGRWFSRNHPHLLRGIVMSEHGKKGLRGRIGRALACRWAHPDFLAYDIRDLPSRFADAERRRGRRVLTWTCRSDDDRARAAAHADQIIYELPG